MKYSYAISALAAISGASAQVGLWGQCGGANYNGNTVCVSTATCSTLNPYYAQCLSKTGGSNPTTTTKSTTTPAVVTTTRANPTTTTTSSSRPGVTTTPPVSTTRSVTTTSSSKPPVTTTAPVTTTRGPTGNPGTGVTLTGNPFAGRQQNPNAYYSSEVYNIAIPSLVAAGKNSLTAAAKAAATVPNFIWFDVIDKVPQLADYLADIRARNAAGASPPYVGTFVVYDLPDRDCAALASNGELSIANGGVNRYKTEYIDPFAAILKQYPDVPVVLIIEPDSLANMITNTGVPKCANAQKSYEECVIYALTKLNLPNVAMYVDAGHAGWLGWPDNLTKAAAYYGNLYKNAGKPSQLRGLATNVANYNAWSVTTCPSYTSGLAQINGICDEKRYINALGPLLSKAGWDAHFVTDQGRSGKQPTGQNEWGDWCNAKGTGFGLRPDSATGDALLDAFVWIKPGGECDGTSDQSAKRYDSHCGAAAALTPAPEAGTWFQAYFEQLLVNANPKF